MTPTDQPTLKLLPCPFCGSDELTMHRGIHLYDDHEIICNKCSASGGNFDEHQYEEWEKNKLEAITAWNTRPIEDELRAELENWQIRFGNMEINIHGTIRSELLQLRAENERLRKTLTRISKIESDIISSTLAQEALVHKDTKE